MEDMIAKYAVKKELFARKPSTHRHGQLKALDTTSNQTRLRSLRQNQDLSPKKMRPENNDHAAYDQDMKSTKMSQ